MAVKFDAHFTRPSNKPALCASNTYFYVKQVIALTIFLLLEIHYVCPLLSPCDPHLEIRTPLGLSELLRAL